MATWWLVCNQRKVSLGRRRLREQELPGQEVAIVCDPRPFDKQPTFHTRKAAAFAEYELISQASAACLAPSTTLDDLSSASDPSEHPSA